jgi:hypothetical protein
MTFCYFVPHTPDSSMKLEARLGLLFSKKNKVANNHTSKLTCYHKALAGSCEIMSVVHMLSHEHGGGHHSFVSECVAGKLWISADRWYRSPVYVSSCFGRKSRVGFLNNSHNTTNLLPRDVAIFTVIKKMQRETSSASSSRHTTFCFCTSSFGSRLVLVATETIR